jgi:hypothetical protein
MTAVYFNFCSISVLREWSIVMVDCGWGFSFFGVGWAVGWFFWGGGLGVGGRAGAIFGEGF